MYDTKILKLPCGLWCKGKLFFDNDNFKIFSKLFLDRPVQLLRLERVDILPSSFFREENLSLSKLICHQTKTPVIVGYQLFRAMNVQDSNFKSIGIFK